MGSAVSQQVQDVVAEGFVPRIGWPDFLQNALFAGALLLHDHGSPCCLDWTELDWTGLDWTKLDWTGATGVATGVVSGASPRYTRPIPRTRRRIGSSPRASAKKISPARVPR